MPSSVALTFEQEPLSSAPVEPPRPPRSYLHGSLLYMAGSVAFVLSGMLPFHGVSADAAALLVQAGNVLFLVSSLFFVADARRQLQAGPSR